MRPLAAGLLALALTACVQPPVLPQAPSRWEDLGPKQDVPYVDTPPEVVAAMLDLAGVTARDVVYDLGSGDGRIVIAAARERGARGVGVVEQDLFATDLREATVVTLYLFPTLNARLMPILLRDLAPGARIVSHDFGMGDWTPAEVRTVRGPYRDHRVYLWVVPPGSR